VTTTVALLRERAGRLARSVLRDRSGSTAVEYGLVAGFVSITIVTAATTIGGRLVGFFELVASKFP